MCGCEQPWERRKRKQLNGSFASRNVCAGIGGQQLKWGTVECAHTHITRSDYLEKLVARQKLGGGSITACFAETKRQRSGSGLESLRTAPHPMRRRDTSTHNYIIV